MSDFTPCPKPAPTVKPPKGMRKINRARVAENYRRGYHSRARVKWVRLQPCAACDVWGYSEPAHVLGNDGVSRKASYRTISPLCGPRPEGNEIYEGCHRLSHRDPAAFRARFPHFNAKKAAAETQRKWLAFINGPESGALSGGTQEKDHE